MYFVVKTVYHSFPIQRIYYSIHSLFFHNGALEKFIVVHAIFCFFENVLYDKVIVIFCRKSK